MRSRIVIQGALALLALTFDIDVARASCVPGFDYAVFAKDQINIQGMAGTDSWNSALGTYATTSACADGDIGSNGTAGGTIHVQSASAQVCGDVWIGVGGNPTTGITGNGSITGSEGALPAAVSLPNVTVPSYPNGAPFSPSYQNTNATLAPNKKYGAVSCKNGSHGAYLQAGVIANTTGVPGNLVFYGGPSATDFQVQGGAGAYFAVYAPQASCQVQGNADIWGAIVCDDAQIQGNAHIHYDKALGSLSGGGFACVSTTEVSRATPIVTTVSNVDAIVQGTFELPIGAPATITTTASVATWSFPYIKGHLRARTAASVTTTASTFSSGTVLFDAATKIPPVSYTGCSTFDGTCRRVFTITSSPATGATTQLRPTRVDWNDTNASAIGALIAPTSQVSGIGASHWQTITRKVLDGVMGGVDRSTVAVIPASTYAGSAGRPTMAYYGGTDGMLHAVCASIGGPCASLGTELWAFVPRVQLPLMRTNTQRVDGSPHVFDAIGDFTGSGTRSWRTILVFQTGFKGTSKGAAYALDITDPANPIVQWEDSAPSTPATLDFGVGMTVATGQTLIGAAPTYLAYLETSNGGTGGAGVVLTAVNVVTGEQVWDFEYAYPSPPRGASVDLPLPSTGVPGGAVAVDPKGTGFVTDVVFGDLYGNLWRLNADDGSSVTGTVPLFQFSTNKRPIGVPPAIYWSGGRLHAAFASGGYVDPTATSWSASTQYLISVKLDAATLPVTELMTACAGCDLAINTTLAAGAKGFSQALVVGTQVFVTTDSTDVNSASFGTSAVATGQLLAIDTELASVGAGVAIAAGAGAIGRAGTVLFTSSAQKQQRLVTGATTTTGPAVELTAAQSFRRMLWLRTK